MEQTSRRPRIVERTVDEEIRRLDLYVRRMEARYGCVSGDADAALAAGRLVETPEVARWLMSYSMLTSLREDPGAGAAAGSPTTGTRPSTKAAWTRSRAKA